MSSYYIYKYKSVISQLCLIKVDRGPNVYERILNQEDDAKLVENDEVLNTEELQDVDRAEDDELHCVEYKKEFNDKVIIIIHIAVIQTLFYLIGKRT